MTLRELSKIVPYNFSCIPRSRLLSSYCFILKGKDAWDPSLERRLHEILCSYLVWRREVISRESFHVWLFGAPWTVACQAPLSMGFPRQESWRGLPFPSPGDLPDPEVNPCLLHWQVDSLPLAPLEKPFLILKLFLIMKRIISTIKYCYRVIFVHIKCLVQCLSWSRSSAKSSYYSHIRGLQPPCPSPCTWWRGVPVTPVSPSTARPPHLFPSYSRTISRHMIEMEVKIGKAPRMSACLFFRYWVGQKVCSGFSRRWYENPNELFGQPNKIVSNFIAFIISNKLVVLPRWLSGEESACQCRRHGFDPWSSETSHATGQPRPCAATPEAAL